MNKSILNKAKKIKVIAMDVDGVLTAGDIIILNSGEEIKVWNVKDRMGFHLAKLAGGLKFAWISGRKSQEVIKRANEIGIDALYLSVGDKYGVWEKLLKRFSIIPKELVYIGDDVVDIPILKRAGLSFCPQDACKEVKSVVDYVSGFSGGKGVVREVIEIILKSQNKWKKAISFYNK